MTEVGGPSATEARKGEPSDRIRVLRELGPPLSPGGTEVASFAALDTAGGKARLVVVERLQRSSGAGAQDVAAWLALARRLVPLEHPNLARVRDAIEGTAESYVITDFVDGARWSDVVAATPGVPLDLTVRVLIDALAGLGALHNMRDAARQPLGLVHCGVSAETLLVGLDGVVRVLGSARFRGVVPGVGAHYLAPEVLLEDDAADARADVYSVGALLWEALTGRALFAETEPSAIVTAVLSGRIPRAEAPDNAPWAAPLVEVASRALSPDPAKRYASAAAMAAELRRIGGAKIVPSIRVAAMVRSSFGERIKARREELERGDSIPRLVSDTPAVAPRTSHTAEDAGRLSDAPTPVPPAPPPPTATTRPPPPLDGETPRAVVRIQPAPVPVMPSDPPVAVDVADLIVSIPAGALVSAPPPSDAPTTKPASVDERITNPVPVTRQAATSLDDDEERTQAVAFPATPLPRELRADDPLPSPAPRVAAKVQPSVGAVPVVVPLASPAPDAAARKKRIIALTAVAVSLVAFIAAAAATLAGGKDERAAPTTAAATTASTPTATTTPVATPIAAPTATTNPIPAAASATPDPTPAPAPTETAAAPPKPKPVIKYDPQGI
jgi:hypothetical protein